jgi:hypothetical protein
LLSDFSLFDSLFFAALSITPTNALRLQKILAGPEPNTIRKSAEVKFRIVSSSNRSFGLYQRSTRPTSRARYW